MSAASWGLAVALALALAAAHLLAARVGSLPDRTQTILASVGGGAAVAYVFVHLLPELASGGSELSDLPLAAYSPTAITEAGLFLTAMVGMVVFFTLDVRTEEVRSSTQASYRAHLVTFGSISLIYAYTMPSLVTTGWDYALLFTVVLGAHILLADRSLARAHPERFRHETRWFGVGAVAIGLGTAYLLPPVQDITLGVLTAFLGGGLLMTTFREELPAASRTRLPWFIGGVTVMAALLLSATVIGS